MTEVIKDFVLATVVTAMIIAVSTYVIMLIID